MNWNEDLVEALREMSSLEQSENEALRRTGERLCPICTQVMEVETRSGVTIDFCPQHGLWLDNGELEHLVKGLQIKDRLEAARLEKKAREERSRALPLLAMSVMLAR